MLTNSQLLASYSKHKIQAAYAAQQIIETHRQNAFIVLSAGQTQTIPAAGSNAVILDTKGNYASSTCTNGNTGNFLRDRGHYGNSGCLYQHLRRQDDQYNGRPFRGNHQLDRTDP